MTVLIDLSQNKASQAIVLHVPAQAYSDLTGLEELHIVVGVRVGYMSKRGMGISISTSFHVGNLLLH